jgi:transposase-like protein
MTVQLVASRTNRHKLSEEQEQALVQEYAAGGNVYALALKYGVSIGTVYATLRPYRVPASAIVTVVEPTPEPAPDTA